MSRLCIPMLDQKVDLLFQWPGDGAESLHSPGWRRSHLQPQFAVQDEQVREPETSLVYTCACLSAASSHCILRLVNRLLSMNS